MGTRCEKHAADLREEILSVLPAAGWHYARLLVDSGGEIEVEPVAGFAVVRVWDPCGCASTRTGPLLIGDVDLYVPVRSELWENGHARLVGPGERPVAKKWKGDWFLSTEPGACEPGTIPSKEEERRLRNWEDER